MLAVCWTGACPCASEGKERDKLLFTVGGASGNCLRNDSGGVCCIVSQIIDFLEVLCVCARSREDRGQKLSEPSKFAGSQPMRTSVHVKLTLSRAECEVEHAMRYARPAPRKPPVDRADVRGMQRALHSCCLLVDARCFFGAYLPVASAFMQRAVPALTLR